MQGTAATLQLRSQLDLTAAAPLAKELLGMRGSDVIIDASGVERVGAQVLQVLASAMETWRSDLQQIEIENPSKPFLDALQTMGLISLVQYNTKAQP